MVMPVPHNLDFGDPLNGFITLLVLLRRFPSLQQAMLKEPAIGFTVPLFVLHVSIINLFTRCGILINRARRFLEWDMEKHHCVGFGEFGVL